MKWLRKLFGYNFPDPEVGQVWQSGYNGSLMRVTEVHIGDSGGISVTVECWGKRYSDGKWDWGIGSPYCHGLNQWRIRLHDEKRRLVPSCSPINPGILNPSAARSLDLNRNDC